MILKRENLVDKQAWIKADIHLPHFDINKMIKRTYENPQWVHFGSGNIFRGFIAMLQQNLLESGKAETGIIAVESYDEEIIKRIYAPYDNLGLQVIMNADGTLEKTVIASISEGLVSNSDCSTDWARLTEIFTNPTLQMVSFTITEKGYNLYDMSGALMTFVQEDIDKKPVHPKHVISQVTALLYERYKNGKHPIAVVSTDNCSHNGEKLQKAVMTVANGWVLNGLVEKEFADYLNDDKTVSFPWSMIDKITPRPSNLVQDKLKAAGFESTEIIETAKHTFIAPFVNAEKSQYLVIEDKFPNGRPPLENAGVYFTDKETVGKVERMKVTTCLNPLHTALAIFGCLLGYNLIADEMKDGSLNKLVHKIGYDEGMPVVTNPGILNPKEFIDEVINIRLPNPNIPDTPQRIATDTSQKLGIRFGETIKAYCNSKELNVTDIEFIPLVIAGWCRYLLGVDDNGKTMSLSPDPLMDTLKAYVSDIKLGNPEAEKIRPILSNETIFGTNLYKAGIGEKIENYFMELASGEGAVRDTLQKYLA